MKIDWLKPGTLVVIKANEQSVGRWANGYTGRIESRELKIGRSSSNNPKYLYYVDVFDGGPIVLYYFEAEELQPYDPLEVMVKEARENPDGF